MEQLKVFRLNTLNPAVELVLNLKKTISPCPIVRHRLHVDIPKLHCRTCRLYGRLSVGHRIKAGKERIVGLYNGLIMRPTVLLRKQE